MRWRVLLVGLVVALTTGRDGCGPTAATPYVAHIRVNGPPRITVGQTISYTATAILTDGTVTLQGLLKLDSARSAGSMEGAFYRELRADSGSTLTYRGRMWDLTKVQ